MFLYHGSPHKGLFDDGFKVTGKPGARLKSFFATPDPGVAALYAGPDGVVYRFTGHGEDSTSILDGRWSEGRHNCPISEEHIETIAEHLRSRGLLKPQAFLDLCGSNFYYGGQSEGATWLRVLHDDLDVLPLDMLASQREMISGDLLRACDFHAVITCDAADGIENDFYHRYSKAPWSNLASVGCRKVIQSALGDDHDYEWVPVVAFLDRSTPCLRKCGEKPASIILSDIGSDPGEYHIQQDIPNWLENAIAPTPQAPELQNDLPGLTL